jgi:hypothetical protein
MRDQDTAARSVTVESYDTSRVTTDISGERVDGALTMYIYGQGQRIKLDALGALHFYRILGAFLDGEA